MPDSSVNNTPDVAESSGASKKFVLSAVVVAAIVVLGLVLSLTNLLGSTKAPPTTTSSSPSSTSVASSSKTVAGEASVCGLRRVQMTGTLASAPDATWALIGTTAAPSIKGQGPGRVEEDGYRSCYARTPTGALLAAGNLLAMGSQPALLGRKMTEESVAPGPGRDAALARPPATGPSSGIRIQIAGFRLLKYDGNNADVDIVLRTSSGAVGAQVFNLKWVAGDWKVVLAPSGDLPSPMTQIPSVAGYVLWAGA